MEEYSTLVNPGKPIPFSIDKETGISDEQVKNAPDLKSHGRISPLCRGLSLAAYDADYEMNFIRAACENTLSPFLRPILIFRPSYGI